MILSSVCLPPWTQPLPQGRVHILRLLEAPASDTEVSTELRGTREDITGGKKIEAGGWHPESFNAVSKGKPRGQHPREGWAPCLAWEGPPGVAMCSPPNTSFPPRRVPSCLMVSCLLSTCLQKERAQAGTESVLLELSPQPQTFVE